MPVISSPEGDEFKAIVGSNNAARSTIDSLNECAACRTVIADRFYLWALDLKWHEKCLQCSHCKKPLEVNPQGQSKCYSKDGRIYCKDDYYKIFGRSKHECNRCGRGIYQGDLVMRLQSTIYHIECFTCVTCNLPLSQGDVYGTRNNLVYCRNHYEMITGANPMFGLGGGIGHVDNCFLNSENAVHPISGQFSPRSDPITGVPAYGAMYGSPGSGVINSSSMSHVGIGPGASVGAGVVASGSPAVVGTGVRKGRPRKRKTVVNGPDAQSAGSCSMHDGNEGNSGPNSHTLSSSVNCGVDILSGTLQEATGVSNGGQNISCHGMSGQRQKRMRTSFKHYQLKAMKTYFAFNQNPDAKDLKNLAAKTALTKRVLQVWFQNARAKWRRNNNKQEQLSADGQPGSQKSMRPNSVTNPESPSTGIDSPGGSSTRPFSPSSPTMTTMMSEQNELVAGNASNGSSLDQFPQISSSSSCNMLIQSSSPSSSHPHHSHHQNSIHQSNSDSIIPALRSLF